jgi:hypothetical protein
VDRACLLAPLVRIVDDEGNRVTTLHHVPSEVDVQHVKPLTRLVRVQLQLLALLAQNRIGPVGQAHRRVSRFRFPSFRPSHTSTIYYARRVSSVSGNFSFFFDRIKPDPPPVRSGSG